MLLQGTDPGPLASDKVSTIPDSTIPDVFKLMAGDVELSAALPAVCR